MEEGGRDDIHVRMHNFLVMHNIITGLPSKYAKIIIKLLQQINRNIDYRIFPKETATQLESTLTGIVMHTLYLLLFKRFTV